MGKKDFSSIFNGVAFKLHAIFMAECHYNLQMDNNVCSRIDTHTGLFKTSIKTSEVKHYHSMCTKCRASALCGVGRTCLVPSRGLGDYHCCIIQNPVQVV